MLGLVRRAFGDMGKLVFLNLYKSLVRPHLEYGNTVWSPSTVSEIKLLEGVQRRATKMLKGYENLEYEDRLRKLGLPTLEYRRLRADLIQVYRLFSGIDKVSPEHFFSIQEDLTRPFTRGHSRKLFKGRYFRRLRKDSFAFRVVNPWNSLNEHIVMSPTLNMFKSRLNDHYKHHPIKFKPSFMN